MPAQGSRSSTLRKTRAVRDAVNDYREKCKRDQPPCWLCGQAIDYDTTDPYSPDSLQVDHMFPVSTHPDLAADQENMRPSHAGCNLSRGNSMTLPELGTTSCDWEALATP